MEFASQHDDSELVLAVDIFRSAGGIGGPRASRSVNGTQEVTGSSPIWSTILARVRGRFARNRPPIEARQGGLFSPAGEGRSASRPRCE
jgi:hypothetical protein